MPDSSTQPDTVVSDEATFRGEGLEVSGLEKAFGKRLVLKGVSFHVKRGEVVGLLGPNGAGKTTSFYMVCGLLMPDAGKVRLDGQEIGHLPMYRRARMGIGYLPQEASIFRGMSVAKNIMAILEVREKNKKTRQERLDQLLADFSISHLRDANALSLSGGERRRVEIARALAANPNYILLDEPFAGVDPIVVGDIRALVLQLKERNIGVLITDHNVRETLDVVDRAYIIAEGQVLTHGKPQEVVNDKRVKEIYLGDKFSL